MTWFKFINKSLGNRKTAVGLTIFTIALSLILLMSIERIRRATEDGFSKTISGVDLLVGARTSPQSLVLFSVFNIGQPTNNVSIETYDEVRKRSEVEWTIPYSLGDGHRGYRVVGTNKDFFKYYQYRNKENLQFEKGEAFLGYFDVVLGAEVAHTLKYEISSPVVVAHGDTTGMGVQSHEDKPFKVVGILKPTGTALDRALYIPLEGMEAIHLDWQTGSAPTKENEITVDKITEQMVKPKTITSFFLRTKSKIEILKLQRWINEYKNEALVATVPGVTLNELWQTLGIVEKVLKLMSFLVLAIGLVTMLVALMSAIRERRREMTILRALGATPKQILLLIQIETFIIVSVSIVLAIVIKVIIEALFKNWLQNRFGIFLDEQTLTKTEILYMVSVLLASLVISAIPAIQARSAALKDGLTLKI